ncbi:Transposon TX1 uncharacterized 149 kDa protein [Vitis vinifera]|uniref:Transposon TX1 uncharacterized 149 kDa protein n=1 Tax=Vitis vinifera TaxID=29760 RepID=A0A438I0E8_VITVI|nr:Transposon TX1 uncharacterized 149 kDa protein [Vitis vinifera]
MTSSIVRSLGVGRSLEWGALDSQGMAGGVLVYWDIRVLELLEMEIGNFSVSCRFKNVEDDFYWVFTGVYGPAVGRLREDFWEEMGTIRGLWQDPWCVGGDFNVIRLLGERNRISRLSAAMRRFSEVIDDLELRDFPLQGGSFTWRGGLNNQTQSRLDRFLVSEDWEGYFSGAIQSLLPRIVSDHCPILLDCGGTRKGPSPFRFENMWLKEEGFRDLIRNWWVGFNFRGSYSFTLSEKLKALKACLKVWNREVFGNVNARKESALKQMMLWDAIEGDRVLNTEEQNSRKKALEEYEKWVIMEEIAWRQKSRELWLREGDRNTGYFHKMANAHRRVNSMVKIKINGTWVSEESDIKEGVVQAFHSLLSETAEWRPRCNGLQVGVLEGENATMLEAPFSEEEVFGALSDLNGDKAPGPDGFTMAFWQFSWSFLKEEVMGFFKEFHDQGKFVKSINASFLVLIPKKGGAEDLKDFRPISLVGSLYKLLAKVLANRLKKVMGKLVSKSQNAFVEGRQILDASLIANEAIHSMQNSGGGGILCKLDIEKAYDHVNWSFLFWLMEMMGFGAKWISWIQWCIGIVSFSVLINGTSSGFFKSSRGLRQGDPLSPYLFVIVMEALSCLLKRAKEGGFLSGWHLSGRGGGGVEITHLLFADDTLVFCEPSTDQVSYLSWLLMWFEAMSGLKVNLDKSEIIAVGRVENVEEVALEFGCKVSRLPSTYLGLPLGARFKEVATWDGVEERLRKRLSIGKGNAKKHEFEIGAYPKGFSVGWWGIGKEASFSGMLAFCGGKGSFMEASHKCKERWEAVGNNLAYAVGNGRRIRFWEDKWCGDDKLCSLFPSLYAISLDKEAWVADVWSHSGGGVWAPRFSRSINDWEVIEVERLLLRLQGRRVYSDVEDEVIWTKAKDKRFSVKSLYKDLDPERREEFPANIIWNSLVPPRMFMELSFLSIWSFMGAPLFNKRSVIGVARALCGKGKEESVACSTLVPLLDCLEGKKQ